MDKYQLFHSLIKGDIKAIAETTGYSREYVGRVLNPVHPVQNAAIVSEAFRIIDKRNNKYIAGYIDVPKIWLVDWAEFDGEYFNQTVSRLFNIP